MNNLRQTNEIGENDQFVIYQGDNAGFASVPQREALQSIKDLIDFNSIQRELQYLNENKVDKNNLQVFDENVITWSGETQEYENKQFLTTVLNYSELGDIVAENGRAVYVKKNGIAGVFVYAANSPKVHDGGVVIKDSQNRIWVRCIEGEPNLEWFEGVSHADALQSCMDQFNFCRLGGATYMIDKPITLKDGATILGRGRGSVLSITYPTSVFVPTKEIGSLTFSDFWVKPAVTRNQGSFIFDFKFGVYRSTFSNLWAGNENYDYTAGIDDTGGFFTSGPSSVVDTIMFHNIWIHRLSGIGYQFGRGSSIWFIGGRTVGLGAVATQTGSIGIQMNGDLGGVWVVGNDVIGLDIGMATNQGNGFGSNRELFLISACFDSCKRYGLVIEDTGCRIHATNLWAASCGNANVAVNYNEENNTVLEINGGDIFNSNSYNTKTTESSHGIIINGGSIKIDNVTFEANGNNSTVSRNVYCANKPRTLSITNSTLRNTVSADRDILRANLVLNYSGNIAERIPQIEGMDSINSVVAKANAFLNKTDSPYTYTPAMPDNGKAITYTNSPFDCTVYMNTSNQLVKVFLNGQEFINQINPQFYVSAGDVISLEYVVKPTWAFKPIF